MIKFHEQHQSGLARVSIKHLFQLSESACLFGRFREFNQVHSPKRLFQCGHDSVEWPGRCHTKALDFESSYGHFHASSWPTPGSRLGPSKSQGEVACAEELTPPHQR